MNGEENPLKPVRFGWLRRLEARLIGIRRGFGEERRVIDVARDAELRCGSNWVLPGLCAGVFILLLAWHKWILSPNGGTAAMIGRIFLFDYLIFMLGGLSGWNMARRWRGSANTVEELSLTSLNPGVVGHVFMAGSLGIWLRLLLIVLLFDAVTPVIYITELAGFSSVTAIGLMPLFILVSVVLTWFHYESIHLAHWMFAIHALPRISLWKAAITNFALMMVIVGLLSAAGSMLTGFLSMFFAVFLGAVSAGQQSPDFWIASYTAWAIGCVPGAILVAWLKRLLCRSYENRFLRGWLLFQWWGAGESRQPGNYPLFYHLHLSLWVAYFGMLEEGNADLPGHRRRFTRRYQQIVSVEGRRQVIAGSEPPLPGKGTQPAPPPRFT